MLNKLDFQGARYTMLGDVPGQEGNDHPTATPMGAFRCRDGHVNIAAPSDRMWKSFCEAVAADALYSDDRYDTVQKRRRAKAELNAEIERAIADLSVEDVVESLNAVGVPCGPIGDIRGGFENPQAKHLTMVKPAPHAELGDLDLIRSPINLSRFPHPERFDHAAPDPGKDSVAVLSSFGFEIEEIEALRASGAVY